MVNPVPSHPRITTAYGVRGSWAAGFHTGEDYGSSGINGANVVATHAGTVIYSGWGGGWGNAYGSHVIIDSGTVRHMYAHLSSRAVSYGQKVAAGQKVGNVGSTGNSTGPHLHYEERTSPFGYANKVREPLFSKSSGGGTSPTCYGDYCYGQNKDIHRALQRRLAEKGHPIDWGAWPTTYYGNSTKAALSAFQRKQGWSGSGADGLPGPSTMDKLGLPSKMSTRSSNRVYASKMRIGQGDSDSVWNIQVALLLRGYSIPAGPTDYFGNQTKTAVAEFQKAQGWTGDNADGIPGPATVKALGLQWVQDIEETTPPPVDPVEPPAGGPDDLYPNAVWDPIDGMAGLREFDTAGGLHQPKIVLHTTETDGKPNWQAMKSGIPHFTFDGNAGRVWQHLDLDVAGYTLKGGAHSPNSAAGVVIQIEMIGRAAEIPGYSQEWFDNLKPLLLWICAKIGCPYVFPFPFTGNDGWGTGGAVRQTWANFAYSTGIVGHSHAPYNDHWDPGNVPLDKLTERVDPEPPPVVKPPPVDPVPPPGNGDYLTRAEFDKWVAAVTESMLEG